jgi:hypothetical protein
LASLFPNSSGRDLREFSGEADTAWREETHQNREMERPFRIGRYGKAPRADGREDFATFETSQLDGGDRAFLHAREQAPSTTLGPGFAATHKLNLDCL